MILFLIVDGKKSAAQKEFPKKVVCQERVLEKGNNIKDQLDKQCPEDKMAVPKNQIKEGAGALDLEVLLHKLEEIA